MNQLTVTFVFVLLLAANALAREESILVRVTGYWRAEGCGERAAWNGARLRPGHCAVDPKKIPYGSTIVFPDRECTAVDTGTAVVNRKSARYCGHNTAQRNALVIDRFFETKREAVAWTNAHPQFITVRVITPDSKRNVAAARHAQPTKSPATPPAPAPPTSAALPTKSAPASVLLASAYSSNTLIRAARRRN